ncbi:MAG TPA: tetratricopeptide repeat protein, partial [candidate division WOR-3 bacterium]|nr:tetratricopeptide repeat protein [candidate division WOR-3 bacterium]
YKKGVKLYLQGKYKEAYNLFKKILKYDPNNVRAKKYLKKAQTRI